MVTQNLWYQPANDWSNLRAKNRQKLLPDTACIARTERLNSRETWDRTKRD